MIRAPAARAGHRTMEAGIFARLLFVLPLLAVLSAAGCAAPGEPPPADAEIAALARQIEGLGPEVDPEEAARAARIAVEHPRELARDWGITDPPLLHNVKVNFGLRPRGLCWHWAKDLEERLEEEGFRTLDVHRAIATPDMPFGGDHSTAIISARGYPMQDGIVLDPWRGGGVLHWMPTLSDPDYTWRPRTVVLHKKERHILRHRAMVSR